MIQFFQKYLNSAFGLAFVFVAVTVVAFLGIDFGGNSSFTDTVATVDGVDISINQLRREVRNTEARYQEQFGDNWSQFSKFINVQEQAVDSLISRTLLRNFVTRLGISASEEAVKEQLAEIPFFNGTVTRDSLEQFLVAYGYNAETLEQELKTTVIFRQFFDSIEALTSPLEIELEKSYEKENTKKMFSYLKFAANDLRGEIDVQEEEMRKIFEETKETYREPKKVSFVAAEFTEEYAKNLVPIDQAELQQIYDDRKSEFVTPARYVFDEILVVPDSTALPFMDTGEEAPSVPEEKLEEVATQIRAEADWDNFDPDTYSGGDIKVIFSPTLRGKADTLVSSDKEVLDELEDGAVSEVFKSGEGFKVLRRVSLEPEEQLPFNEVRIQIEQEIRDLDASSYMMVGRNNFFDKAIGQKLESKEDFKKLVLEEGASLVETTNPLSDGQAVKDNLKDITTTAIGMQPGEIAKHEEQDRVFVVYVEEIVPSYIPEFEKARPRIEASYLLEESKKLARERADSKLEEGFSEDDELQKTELVLQSGASGELFFDKNITERLFTLNTEGEVLPEVLENGANFYLAKLEQIEKPEEISVDDEYRDNYSQQARSRVEQNILATLRLRKDIRKTPGLISE